MTIRVAGGDVAYFYSVAARVGGSISVAHGLSRTPKVVIATANKSGGGAIVQGSHDGTNLAINNTSSGASVVLFAM